MFLPEVVESMEDAFVDVYREPVQNYNMTNLLRLQSERAALDTCGDKCCRVVTILHLNGKSVSKITYT